MLKVKNLSKNFKRSLFSNKKNQALDNISFEIKRGEVFGIVGKSGSGKTTLANTLLKMLPPSSGQVLFEGIDLYGKKQMKELEFRKKVQAITQNFNNALNPNMMVMESMKEVFLIHGKKKHKSITQKDLIKMLNEVALGKELLIRYPRQLSGGQLQRILISRVVSLKPELIIADEPVSCLDMSVQARIIHLLMKLKKEHDFTLIFISHDIGLTTAISDRIAVMHKGKIVEIDNANKIYHDPQNNYTKLLIESSKNSDFTKREKLCLAI